MAMALTGKNGDNETNVGASNSISYSLHDENNKEIPISNLEKPIEFWIFKEDLNSPSTEYQYVNAVNASQIQNGSLTLKPQQVTSYLSGFIVSGFKLSGTNLSLSVQIKPENKSIGYLALLKFGDNPVFNLTSTSYYDLMSIFCPTNDLIQEDNDSFYLLFANMSRVNAYKVIYCV